MYKIILEHTKIIINDYDLGDCPSLENFFSIWDQLRHESNPYGIHYKAEERQLIIPRGVDIPYIARLFGCHPYVNKRHDPLDRIEPIRLKYKPRDDKQKEILRFMTGKNEYYYTATKSMLAINGTTGIGKTYCCITNTALTRLRSIMITSSLEWIDQWKKAIMEHSDIKSYEIFIMAGISSIHQILKRGVSQYKFILASIQTIIEYGKKYGYNKITELFKFLRVGNRYMDEAHLCFESMMLIDFYTDTYKTFYVTATPYRSNEDQNRIYEMYFKNIPSIDLFDENTDPHTDYTCIRYNSHPSPVQVSNCKNKYGLDRNRYVGEYIINRPNFYNISRLIIEQTLAMKGKILVYIGVNKSIDKFKYWMETYYPFLRGHIGIYTSQTPKDIKKQQLEKKYILSTTKSCGAAMDIKGLICTVILAEPFKSKPLAIQSFGRTRADGTHVIEAVDDGFYQIVKFYYYKKPIIEKYATSMDEIRYKQDETLNREVNESLERFYGATGIPEIYLENNKRLYMMRKELMPFNEYNERGLQIYMKRV